MGVMVILRKKALILLMVFVLIAGLPAGQIEGAASGAVGVEKTELEAAAPAVPETTAVAAVLLEPTSNKIIYEKELNKQLPMASVTKLMTLLLAVEAVEQGKFKLDDKVVTSENAWEMGGSQVYLEPGEEMSLWEMLMAIGLQSANDSSVAVAEHIAGSEEAFVQAMNDKAKELGLVNTNFVNCHGLTADNHYTSAYDMAVILKEGLKYPLFRKITSMKESELRGGAFKLWNTNKLLWWYDGADAGKTGWTEAAKYCLASSAERDGLRIICVVLGTSEPGSHFRESTKLLDYGFARYKAVNFAEQGASVGAIKVGKGQVDRVEAQTAEKVSVVALKGEEKGFESRVELADHLDAPVQKGQVVGAYVVTKGGQEVKRVNLVAGDDVLKTTVFEQVKRVIDHVF
ncbi:D-alanyl-D-alanine carboxypeptidase [Pelotomaculum terephthalicicum JT]|uniref:D-alanyl-D-alanine carboxypeptidase family protein n=1 Tax=Pelotomaculum terephthalicicum TaxID=206393 RepID=UPI0009D38C19|nr:D-alanyl-D-alanine carboxypeptidase family protein [Pelotomaculum terephthalicicum]MCG9968834.1 D-alanyl-D-alanine carboxypeptidase [Pelotomaculum terephthalicicum JT]OPY59508.1 MAG: D-alanyl-D-alanine carboxypeptidase DacF precursor [Pelotomaculum sp. PtaU1.Bin035]